MIVKNLFVFGLMFASVLLMGVGTYGIVDELFAPKGNMFESVVLFYLGAILLVVMTAISYLIRTLNLFSEIYSKQLDMQQEMTNFYTKSLMAQKPKGITDILGAMGTASSITVTNMETGETTSAPIGNQDSMQKMNELISNLLGGNRNRSVHPTKLEDMSIEQLEGELAKAVKLDDFEKANEIKNLIHNKKNPGSQSADYQGE